MSFLRKRDARTEHVLEERLSAYLDGELSSRDRAAVDRHLSACRHCRWNLETLRQTIRWTASLPAVPVPRAFTIPVQPRPVPVPRWRWSMPLLQGATALVAVLFFLAVAGNAYLTRMVPVSQGAPEAAAEGISADAKVVEVTLEVEAVLESEPAGQVESPVSELPPEAPREVSPTGEQAEEPAQEMLAAAPALEAEGAETRVSEAVVEKVVEDADAATETARAAGEAEPEEAMTTPTMLPSPVVATPTRSPSVAAPTVVAKAEVEEVQPAAAEPEQVGTAVVEEPIFPWLGTAEIALGAAFVLLGTITMILMVRRLRTG